MLSPKRPASAIKRPVAKQRKCGVCGQLGHNRQKCPAAPAAPAAPVVNGQVDGPNFENNVEEANSPPPPVPTADDDASYIDWDSVLYVVFDLETTGRSQQRDEIIKLAAVILDCSGVKIEDAFFSEFVKPTKPIPPFITELTSITNNDVSTAESFAVVGDAFIGFIQQHADEFAGMVKHIILVGHNG
jgi:DNA polymerase III epsilon subunit-like protein